MFGLVIYLLVAMLLLGGLGFAAVKAKNEIDKAVVTTATFDQAYSEFARYEKVNNEWPNEVTAKALLVEHRDGWGTALRYEIDDNHLQLLSAGFDQRFGTADDMSKQWRVRSSAAVVEKPIIEKPAAMPGAASEDTATARADEPSEPQIAEIPEPKQDEDPIGTAIQALKSESSRDRSAALALLLETDVTPEHIGMIACLLLCPC